MSGMNEKTVPSVRLGGGGLGGLEGEPMGTDPHGYRPEPSVTGPTKGPMVPANLPEKEIIERIEQVPLSAPGDPTREHMHPAREGPTRVRPMTWKEITTFINSVEGGSDGIIDDVMEVVSAIKPMMSMQHIQELLDLRSDYQQLLSGDEAHLYWPKNGRKVPERPLILAFFTLHARLTRQE